MPKLSMMPPVRRVAIPHNVGVSKVTVWPGEHDRPERDLQALCAALIEKMPEGMTDCLVLSLAANFMPRGNSIAPFSARLFQVTPIRDDDAYAEITLLDGVIIGEKQSPEGSIDALLLTAESADQFESQFNSRLARLKPANAILN